jgi:tetratricopeptide (TPR) repeat protein
MLGGRDEEVQSRLHKAIGFARQRLEVNPGDHECRATLALYLARTDQVEQARIELEQMATASHLSMDAHWALGETFLALGDKERAIEHVIAASEKGLPLFLLKRNPAFKPLYDHPKLHRLITAEPPPPSTP